MLVLNLRAFENKKYTAYDHFHGNGLYGEILTRKDPIRTLGFALPYNNMGYRPGVRSIYNVEISNMPLGPQMYTVVLYKFL